MADVFELLVALDLRDELPDAEVAEIRWHLGLGDRPATATALRTVVVDERGVPVVVDDDPRPLLGERGGAYRIGGALVSALVRRPGAGQRAWALTARQEVHPDDFGPTGELLARLASLAADTHRDPDGAVCVGWTRFHESRLPEPLLVRDGTVRWPG